MIKQDQVISSSGTKTARPQQGIDWARVLKMVQYGLGRVVLYAVLAVGAIIFAAPLLWMISTSLKPEGLVYNIPIVWIPPDPKWSNYITAWTKSTPPFTVYYANTIYITTMNIIGLVLSSSLVAFGFARIRFWKRDIIF